MSLLVLLGVPTSGFIHLYSPKLVAITTWKDSISLFRHETQGPGNSPSQIGYHIRSSSSVEVVKFHATFTQAAAVCVVQY